MPCPKIAVISFSSARTLRCDTQKFLFFWKNLLPFLLMFSVMRLPSFCCVTILGSYLLIFRKGFLIGLKKKNVSSSRTNNVSCRPALNLCFPGAARYKREGDARTRTWLGGVLNLLCLQKSNKKLHPVIINI